MPRRQRNHGLRKVCDCPRRQWAKCDHPWHFSFKWNGTHHRFSLDKQLGKHIDNKTDAEKEAETIRIAIREGRFGQPAPRDEMTLRQLADVYLERYVMLERASREQAFRWALNAICKTEIQRPTGQDGTAIGAWRLADIVTDSIERFREARRAKGTGVIGTNRQLGILRALFNWGIRVGYVEASPFKRGGEAVVRLAHEPKRQRRLNADTDEETKLLAACGPHLRAVVECALETGMRRGEILSLQWSQIEGMKAEKGKPIAWAARPEIVLPWQKTKTRTDRRIPISDRLRKIVAMRRFDPSGEPMAEDRYVFGNEIGQQVKDVKRAWMTAVLKAHGHKPRFTDTANLDSESRAAFEAIGLHLHDLRREAGSRWLEGGVELHTVRDWLGHTSIAQTSTYLAGTLQTRHDAMRRFEAHRSALQQFATGSKTGGRKRLQSAAKRHKKPNKNAVYREATIM